MVTGLWAWLAWPWVPVFVALVALVLLEQWWHQRYFERRGIPYLPAIPFVGSMLDLVSGRCAIAEMALKIYRWEDDAPVVGFFEFRTPITVLRDPDLIRDICVKRFEHFRNHRPIPNQKADDLFGRSLFALKDQRWKDMRATMSPAFTASKMRALFALVSKCGRQSAGFLERRCKDQPLEANQVYEVEFRDFITRFATDVIATSAFGIECDSLGQPKNEFYTMGKEITDFSGFKKGILMLILAVAPKLAELLGISLFNTEQNKYFRALIRQALEERAQKGIYRPDVLQLMMDARDGRLGPQLSNGQPRVQMSDDDIMGQSMLFFFAGFETISLAICFSCYLLAIHPEVQDRLLREIDEALGVHGGEINYEAVQTMKYLDMVLHETLRLYPPVSIVDRLCACAVELPAGEGKPLLSFHEGDVLWLPVMGLHRDSRYWPDPDKFDPERFSDENKHNIHPFTYIPFGAGPRVCLGQ